MTRASLCVALLVVGALPVLAADTVELTIASDIAGASVYIGGIAQKGATPLVARFTAPDNFFKAKTGCLTTAEIAVRWVSGAEASIPALNLCARTGKKQVVSFNRPVGLEGRDTDAQFALQLQQATIARRQQIIAEYQAGRVTIAPVPLPPPLAGLPRTYCTSSLMGSTVYTSCSGPPPVPPYRLERVIQ